MALTESLQRAIFLDKDGTLIKNVPFNVDPSKVVFERGATLFLSSLKSLFQYHVVTNQAGVAFGMFQEEELQGVKNKLHQMFQSTGSVLVDFHYCPHHPEGKNLSYRKVCECRKPGDKLLRDAARKYAIDLCQSWMVGDILDDIECGRRAGCKTIMIDNGNETEWIMNDLRGPHYKVENLEEAALIIMNEVSR